MFVEGLGVVGHLILHGSGHEIRISLRTLNGALGRVAHVAGHSGLRRQHSTVFDDAAILEYAAATLKTTWITN